MLKFCNQIKLNMRNIVICRVYQDIGPNFHNMYTGCAKKSRSTLKRNIVYNFCTRNTLKHGAQQRIYLRF